MRQILLLLPFALLACSNASKHPLYTQSDVQTSLNYQSFDEYVLKIKEQLLTNRYFLSQNKEAELAANMPIELKPKNQTKPSKAVLLIHGLGDSPFSFVDIAKSLVADGLVVRTLLLSGHGTRPADMLKADVNDWKNLVVEQVKLLKQDADEVYLGGFSTGGNLAFSYAVDDPSIKGLMLFSPGFVPNEPTILSFSKWIAKIKPWLLNNDPSLATNYTRYNEIATNGFTQYYQSAKEALSKIKQKKFTRPVFMVLSEHDSVIDTKKVKQLFETQFDNPKNKLIWFGSSAMKNQEKVRNINSYNPKWRVQNMSHMGLLFSPDNPYYGINGTQRICRNTIGHSEDDYEYCKNTKEIWYSAWGTKVGDKKFARLTFNPWYQIMIDDLNETFSFNTEKNLSKK